VVLTGLSGSGKGTVLKAFEDLGYYCVDNLPVDLLPALAELSTLGGRGYERVALLVDARERENLKNLPATCRRLARKYPATLVFVEASDDTLLRRFSETRRPHPLGRGRRIVEGIRHERQIMAPIRRAADLVIDTSRFNVHELRQFITDSFQAVDRPPMVVSIVTFGYRFGLPPDADLVFDVRFLPNPHFVPGLRRHSGREKKVARYVLGYPQSRGFLRRVVDMLAYLLPRYVEEGKSYLTIAFGCTGGHHRSVVIGEAVARALERRGYRPKVIHRDIDRSAT
jgi:UPF0042 nucleotide-binding protein